MNIVNRLLKKNLSKAQLIGFTLSNFIGLAIVVAGLQFYEDVRSIWEDEDSFIKKDYIVVNKEVTGANTLGKSTSDFTPAEIADLREQPWVRKVGEFTANNYRVYASIEQGGRGMSTYFFFEAIPDEFIDVSASAWHFTPGDRNVPIILSKDYLTLYNFGFSGSAGLPQLSESLMESIPMTLRISSENGERAETFEGRVVGFSNRLNTILVPESFMTWSNDYFGGSVVKAPSRLIIDVSSPGDVAIARYLKDHDMELSGDKKNSQATFLVNIITGVVLTVGGVITILSFFILLLSISLLMTKNRDKLHALLMLGYDESAVGAPYRRLIIRVCMVAYLLAVVAMILFRLTYIHSLAGMIHGVPNLWLSPLIGLFLTLLIIIFNLLSVSRKVRQAF